MQAALVIDFVSLNVECLICEGCRGTWTDHITPFNANKRMEAAVKDT